MTETVYKRKVRKKHKRFFNTEGAEHYIGDLSKNTEIFGITKGQFSIIDILEHVLNFTGKASVMIGTWTAGYFDLVKIGELLESDSINEVKIIIDAGFKRRMPDDCEYLLKTFGQGVVRFLNLHAKFIVIQNKKYNFIVQSSMNLNQNKRIENFSITEDKDLCFYYVDFFKNVFENVSENDDTGNIDQIDATDKDPLDINFLSCLEDLDDFDLDDFDLDDFDLEDFDIDELKR